MVQFDILALSRRRLIVLLTTTFLFALIIWFLNAFVSISYPNFWNGFYTEDYIGTFFCERTFMDRIVRQPINTFTNFIYWISALVIIRRGWKDQSKTTRYNLVSANPFYSITYGVILLYTFFASTIFHASLIHVAARLDFSAVYSLALFPLMYFTHRVWLLLIGHASNQKHTRSTRTLIVVFSVLYILFTFFVPGGMDDYVVLALIVVLILFGIVVEFRDPGKTNHRYLVTCVISISIAVMWFAFDTRKVLCNPDSIIQPHSLWHLFAGTSAFYFYMYIRSEKNKL